MTFQTLPKRFKPFFMTERQAALQAPQAPASALEMAGP